MRYIATAFVALAATAVNAGKAVDAGIGLPASQPPPDSSRAPQTQGKAFAPEMMSLFSESEEERELDQYAAALASQECLRKRRDAAVREAVNPLAYLWLKVRRGDAYNEWMESPLVPEAARVAQNDYLRQAGCMILSYGMTISRFNQLSRDLGQDKSLRKRVQQQAYLYRVKAELGGDKIPLLEEPKLNRRSDRVGRGRRSQATQSVEDPSLKPEMPTKLLLFAKSLREVEVLRLRTREDLMHDMGLDVLPSGMCQPGLGSMMSDGVHEACDVFVAQAEALVRGNGLKNEEFNRLLARTRSNVLYRWQLWRYIRRLDKIES